MCIFECIFVGIDYKVCIIVLVNELFFRNWYNIHNTDGDPRAERNDKNLPVHLRRCIAISLRNRNDDCGM